MKNIYKMWKPLLHYKIICIMKMFDETTIAFWNWKNEPQVLRNLLSRKISFQIRLGPTGSWERGITMGRTSPCGAVGLRSQRSQSHFTAHSSTFSTTDSCNKGWVLSLHSGVHKLRQFDECSGQDNSEGFYQNVNCSFVCKCVLAFGK